MANHEFVLIGKILKTSGFKGEVVISCEYDLSSEDFINEFVFIEIQNEHVPFLVLSAEKLKQSSFIIYFEDVTTHEKAKELCGSRLFLPTGHEILEKLHEKSTILLKGYNVIDEKKGKIGIVEKIIELPQHNILQVFSGKKEILIPFNENIVKKIDQKKNTITIEAPEGLIDFYLK